ncbi:MAG: PspC domain-containing protein [Methanoregulaceae archaeon]|nr:PspC domain-containing protein [Methanoregulaceae archaeon]
MERLYRSRTDRIIAGVCGGIGAYYTTDPNLVRVLWVVLTLLSVGIGIIAYIAAWILIPEESESPS